MVHIQPGAPVASALIPGLYGVVQAFDRGCYTVKWDMGGYVAVTHDSPREALLGCDWVVDCE